MSQTQIKEFLARLEQSLRPQGDSRTGLQRRHDAFVPLYAHFAAFPGEQFMYIGESVNQVSPPANTDTDETRKHIMTLLFRDRGRTHRCFEISDLMQWQDFAAVLTKFEQDLIERNPDGAIGPAYDLEGNEVPGAFTLWRRTAPALTPQEAQVPQLSTASR